MRIKITVLVLLALAGCSSFKEYAQDRQVRPNRDPAMVDRSGYDPEGKRHEQLVNADRLRWALETDKIPRTQFVGGPHKDFLAVSLMAKYGDFFKNHAIDEKQRFWISWRTFESTFKHYGSCPPPPRGEPNFGPRECLNEAPMIVCEASVGLVPVDEGEAKPKTIYSSTMEERNQMNIGHIKAFESTRMDFAAGCISNAIDKMRASYVVNNRIKLFDENVLSPK